MLQAQPVLAQAVLDLTVAEGLPTGVPEDAGFAHFTATLSNTGGDVPENVLLWTEVSGITNANVQDFTFQYFDGSNWIDYGWGGFGSGDFPEMDREAYFIGRDGDALVGLPIPAGYNESIPIRMDFDNGTYQVTTSVESFVDGAANNPGDRVYLSQSDTLIVESDPAVLDLTVAEGLPTGVPEDAGFAHFTATLSNTGGDVPENVLLWTEVAGITNANVQDFTFQYFDGSNWIDYGWGGFGSGDFPEMDREAYFIGRNGDALVGLPIPAGYNESIPIRMDFDNGTYQVTTSVESFVDGAANNPGDRVYLSQSDTLIVESNPAVLDLTVAEGLPTGVPEDAGFAHFTATLSNTGGDVPENVLLWTEVAGITNANVLDFTFQYFDGTNWIDYGWGGFGSGDFPEMDREAYFIGRDGDALIGLPIPANSSASTPIRMNFDNGTYQVTTSVESFVDGAANNPGDRVYLSQSDTIEVEQFVAPQLSIAPASHDFDEVGEFDSATTQFTIGNDGSSMTELTLGTIEVTGSDASAFQVSGGSCSENDVLFGGDTCDLEVTFVPGASGSFTDAKLSVASDANIATANLSGTGILPDWSDSFDGAFDEAGWQFFSFNGTTLGTPATAQIATGDYLQISDPVAVFAGGFIPRSFGESRVTSLVNADGTNTGTSPDNQIDQGVISHFNPDMLEGYAAYLRYELNFQDLVLVKFDADNIDPALIDERVRIAESSDDDWSMDRMYVVELDVVDQGGGESLLVARAFDADTGELLATVEAVDGDDAGEGAPHAPGYAGVTAIANSTGVNGTFDTASGVSSFGSADLSTNSIDFGAVETGATDQQTVTLTNNGNAALVISDITIGGAAAADYTLQNETCLSASPLAAGANCTFDVDFSAGDTGQRSAEVLIDSSASTSPDMVLLDAAVFASELTLTPPTQDFGDVLLGASSSVFTFTVGNNGDGVTDLALNSIDTTGDFNIVAGGSCTASSVLDGGESCTVDVEFAPNSVGMLSGTLNIGSDVGTVIATLEGDGIQPAITITPASLNFGDQEVSTTSAEGTVTIANSGSADLTISSVSMPNAPFAQTASGTCSIPGVLTPASTCTLSYTFSPTVIGTQSTSIVVTSDAPSSPDSFSLVGNGVMPVVAVNPAAVNFDDIETVLVGNQSAAQTIQVSNTGTTPLIIDNVTIAGSNAGDFDISSNGCPDGTILNSGLSCNVGVFFAPTDVGARTAGLQINSNAPTSPDNVPLSGTGAEVAALAINPPSFDFNGVVEGDTATTTFTLSNSGDPVSSLDLTSIAVTGAEFSVAAGGTCSATSTLIGGDDCTVIVEFAPTAVGAVNGTLTVESDAGNVSATLDGEGLAAANLQITPTEEDFGSVLITESATSSFSLSNTGDPVTTITLDAPALAAATDAEFSISGGDCAAGTALIGGGPACTVEITFDPISVAASFTGTLEVGSDANNVSATLSGDSELPDWADGFGNADPGSGGFEQDWTFLGFDDTFSPLVPTTAEVTNEYLQIRDPDAVFAVGYVERTFNDNRTSALVNADGFGSGSDSGDGLDNQIDQGVIARFDPVNTSGYAAYMRMELNAQELVLIKFDASNLDPALVDIREVVATSTDPDWNMGRMFITELDLVDQGDGSVLVVARALDAASGAVLSRLEFTDPAVNAFDTGFSGVVAIANSTGLNGSFDTTAAVSAFASADLVPDSIDFGAVETGATDQQTVTLTNNGNAALDITNIAIGGAAAADYTLQNETCLSASPLAAGANCTFDVDFSAGDTGQRSAEVLIDSSASTSPDMVLLDAAVFASELTLTPLVQDFGDVLVGASSSPITFTVSNNGDGVTDLALNSIATTGDYNILAGGTCSATTVLDGGDTCTVDVVFAPNSVGMLSGTLDIGSDVGMLSADLSGDGLAPAALAIDPTGFDFEGVLVGDTATTSFTLSNTGDTSSSLDLTSIAVTGADFSVTTGGTCTASTTLIGGATCTVEVQFAPNSVAIFSGSLAVESDAGDVSASLNGDGLEPAELIVSPLDHYFGNVTVGDSSVFTFTLSNNGDPLSELMLTGINSSGNPAFSVIGGSCQAGVTMLDGQQSCTVEVQFAPAVLGSFGGSLNVNSNANNITAGVAGEGTAVAAIQLAPDNFNFEDVIVGDTETTSFIVSNTGGADSSLTLTSISVTGDGFADAGTGTCSTTTTLDGGENCTVVVAFAPTVAGAASGSLDISSDVGDVAASLSGNGLADEADLTITAEPLEPFGELGAEFGYIVVVANAGPADVTAADVTSTLDTGLDNVTWACSADAGAACPASGIGDLNEMVDLSAGSMVTFTILADLTEGDAQEQVVSEFTVTGPVMPPDPDPANNTTEISTQSGVFADGFESPPEAP